MSRLGRALLCAAFVLAISSAAARTAQACSVCLAGDPIFSTQGSSGQEVGDIAAYLEWRGWRKSSAALPHGEEEEHEEGEEMGSGGQADGHHDPGIEESRSRRLDLYLSWTPIDRATLTLDLPWVWNSIVEHEPDAPSMHTSLSGFGDASATASVVAWRSRPVLPSTWVEARAFLKAPTGRDEQRVAGEQDPHLQTGTGSWDFGAGAAAVHRLEWGSLYASAFYRVNTEGALRYEYGDVVLANAALELPLGHALGRAWLSRFVPGLELNFRWAARDEQDGERYDSSGGSILYLTPSLRVRLPAFGESQRAWLRAAVQIPATNAWLYGEQNEDPVWSIGLGYGF
jgi:hypothetical protein